MKKAPVVVYTDGASLNNPGPGGFGVVMMYGKHRKEISRGFRKTTNNRMELLAVIEALRAVKRNDLPIIIHSDSKYVVDAVKKGWVFGWEKKGFAKKKNPDLWRQFLELYKQHNVELRWVKGHAGIEENERCDQLATSAAAANPFEIDQAYESGAAG